MFMFLFLFFSMLLLCSFFRLKELFQVKKGVTTSLLFFVLKMPNICVGRMTVNGERKRGWPNLVLCLTKFVDTLLQPISKSQKSYLSLKRLMWKTEHFLFRWTLWVLTQIYRKTRVYWNCLSERIWKFLQRQPIPTKKISSTSMESTTYKAIELQWAQRQQFWFLYNNSKQNCL